MATNARLEREIKLNQIRQGVITTDDGISWFLELETIEQKSILSTLHYMCIQAGATTADVLPAIIDSNLKPTYTPCVMLQTGKLRISSSKALQLPAAEYLKLFRIFLSLFKISDSRRAKFCGPNCRHWWHKDLARNNVLEEIRKGHIEGK